MPGVASIPPGISSAPAGGAGRQLRGGATVPAVPTGGQRLAEGRGGAEGGEGAEDSVARPPKSLAGTPFESCF